MPTCVIIPASFHSEEVALMHPRHDDLPPATKRRNGYRSTFLGNPEFEVSLSEIDSLHVKQDRAST